MTDRKDKKLTLSVVDQSPVRRGGTAGEALRETIELAKAAERLGYSRFWVAEHHNIGNFAGTAPEIMVGQIAAQTSRIRVGSGGVMLPHYSAFKVAEVFRMLESLFPGRIDLGLGRAPGSDQRTMAALSYPRHPLEVSRYPEQVRDLLAYLHNSMDAEHPFASLRVGPGEKFSAPEVWLLGSRIDSAALAAEMGLGFGYAHFFGMSTEHGPQIVEMYRQNFKPSEYLSEPRVNVALQVLCAETMERAERIASSRNVSRVKAVQGERTGILPPDEALAIQLRPDERAYLFQLKQNYIDGDPEYVKRRLYELADEYRTDDLSIVTICYDFEDRVRSYELVAEAMGLRGE